MAQSPAASPDGQAAAVGEEWQAEGCQRSDLSYASPNHPTTRAAKRETGQEGVRLVLRSGKRQLRGLTSFSGGKTTGM